ncbi:alpha-L-rhamnosidase C-terminal domain-containing protein, partial [uncultured Meiothermus sp.]|uniref:alpha-L-rhamnosidase C-terminal domain-containing protein n=1 Tax=uncultured Meiothermus sp. TaxID=157471 RepID=UPI002607C1EF
STEVLGITPSAPGFAEIQVAPRPVDLSWAKGVYPTPHGNVEIDWYRRDDRLEVSLTTPQRARFVLPEGWERLEVDGVLVGDGSAVLEPGSYQIAAQHHQRKRP